MSRRGFSQSSGLATLLAGCAQREAAPALPPLRASTDRLFDITVCLRPFRAAGPRLDVEQVGDAMVVHNYGHGGSFWLLSWGSSTIAVRRAMAASPRAVAVIGCGALGLTSAILAQRAGASVTVYARERIGQTRSARATGTWTPDSRIALDHVAGPGFGAVWEEMPVPPSARIAVILGCLANRWNGSTATRCRTCRATIRDTAPRCRARWISRPIGTASAI